MRFSRPVQSLALLGFRVGRNPCEKGGCLRKIFLPPFPLYTIQGMEPGLPPDIVIAGAGIIGLTLALELEHSGASVTLLDTASAAGGASIAAAGMLAAEDPHNPRQLSELSLYSVSLYDRLLDRLTTLSGLPVPYQT